MVKVIYEIVEHNGGFAYRVGDVFSETFGTHEAAHRAAEEAAQRQQVGDRDEQIEYQDSEGDWHNELAPGDRRPEAEVEDHLPQDDEARDHKGRKLNEDEVPDPDRAPSTALDDSSRR